MARVIGYVFIVNCPSCGNKIEFDPKDFHYLEGSAPIFPSVNLESSMVAKCPKCHELIFKLDTQKV